MNHETSWRTLAAWTCIATAASFGTACGGSAESSGNEQQSSTDGGTSGAGGSSGSSGAGGNIISTGVGGGVAGSNTAGSGGSEDASAMKDTGTDAVRADPPSVMGSCTMGGNECPAGYECGCGGPGPGQCQCHKKCGSASDCTAPDSMCGCSANLPNICVSTCFCLCN